MATGQGRLDRQIERGGETHEGSAVSHEAESGVRTVWQIKASTLCNLRCRYCYEWDRLSDRARIPLKNWGRIFRAMAAYREHRLRTSGISSDILAVWHGGEPLLLPAAYVREVLNVQRETLYRDSLSAEWLVNAVQTNLYRPNRTLDLMIEEGFVFSVSHDFAPQIRVDRAGRDSEALVTFNLKQLVSCGATCGVALVLGRHNHRRLVEIHDILAETGAQWLQINPMYEPPDSAPGDGLALSTDEVVEALARLMEHRCRIEGGLPVAPLDRVWRTVRRHRDGRSTLTRDRRRFGETRFVVHPDGTLAYEAGSASGYQSIGNIFEQDLAEILGSSAYESSLDLDDGKRARHCAECRYEAACNGRAILELRAPAAPGPCPVEAKLCAIAEATLDAAT